MIDIEQFKETLPDTNFTKYQVLNIIDFLFNCANKHIHINKFKVVDLKVNDLVYFIFDDKLKRIIEINKDDIGMYIYYEDDTVYYYLNSEEIYSDFILIR